MIWTPRHQHLIGHHNIPTKPDDGNCPITEYLDQQAVQLLMSKVCIEEILSFQVGLS